MPNNKSRYVVFEESSKSGRLMFRYYSTGSLAIFDPNNMVSTRKTQDGSFLRINTLFAGEKPFSEEHFSSEYMARILDALDECVPLDYPESFDYNSHFHWKLLEGFVESTELEPRLRFATFASGLRNTRKVSFQEIYPLVLANAEHLERAFENRLITQMVRPDIGVVSGEFTTKSEGIVKLLEFHRTIMERLEDPGYGLAWERFREGMVSSYVESLKREHNFFQRPVTSPERQILTEKELMALLKAKQRWLSGSKFTLENQLLSLVSYSWAKFGEARTEELLHFLVKYGPKPENSYYLYVPPTTISNMEWPLGELTLEMLYEALPDVETPFEWSLSLQAN